jgi:hypothetical protein
MVLSGVSTAFFSPSCSVDQAVDALRSTLVSGAYIVGGNMIYARVNRYDILFRSHSHVTILNGTTIARLSIGWQRGSASSDS